MSIYEFSINKSNEILDTHFLNKNKYTFKQVYKYKIGEIIKR